MENTENRLVAQKYNDDNNHLIKILSRLISFKVTDLNNYKLECGPMPNVMVTLLNIGGALCSMPQSLAGAHYWSAMQ